ncbi:aromatic ring-hydroxylating oxygenase subunit alpha [Pseudomonas benzenivorans]|uniref:Aromatic ring-hydroxylating dioxygenase subunit alpha n=1 Tax=Pseudomonas benzenivorans TaxID=556533 RepID=A0ABY5HBT7_9PSED|nr:aromatic ring-hydroxylating dioxygenase subunit alpha [Pseudomonas benzenivorans]UTW08822.1 aromatic ring-hydroxylating dioxygenase subunit alpha [Pseudomonas benzenivorans]
MENYISGMGLPQEAIFDLDRAKRLYSKKWFFAGTRGDVPKPRDYLKFSLFDDEYFLLHGTDGVIRCMANRCAHQSARLLRETHGTCPPMIMCPNHQWVYELNGGRLLNAPGFAPDFPGSELGQSMHLDSLPVVEVHGLLFASLDPECDRSDLEEIEKIIAPYAAPFGLQNGGYKLAYHECEIVDASWFLVMINNRECCHCNMNHQGLVKLFDPSSFNGAQSPAYEQLFARAVQRWESLGLAWQEQAFSPNDCCRVARYPMQENFQSITFDGKPASKKLIGPFKDYDQSTLSMWFNPNAWIHFTSDHIATNWVLPLGSDKCALYTSWIVREDAVEGVDYHPEHMKEVWQVTNAEDVALCQSMTAGAKSAFYRPGPFAKDEKFCVQLSDWYMEHSAG